MNPQAFVHSFQTVFNVSLACFVMRASDPAAARTRAQLMETLTVFKGVVVRIDVKSDWVRVS